MTPRSPITDCGRGRCRRKVFKVKIIKARGVPAEEELDSVPQTWEEGARIKLTMSGHLPDGEQHAEKLTASQIHRAFAVKELYVPHADLCPAQKRKTGTTRKGGGRA
jgi:hypothetical protein